MLKVKAETTELSLFSSESLLRKGGGAWHDIAHWEQDHKSGPSLQKHNFLTKGLVWTGPKPQPERKISCPSPKEFLAKSLKKGRKTNKAGHLVLPYLKYWKYPPLQCDVLERKSQNLPPPQRHFLTWKARGYIDTGTAFPKAMGRWDERKGNGRGPRSSMLTTSKGNSRPRSRRQKRKPCPIWWVDAADCSNRGAGPQRMDHCIGLWGWGDPGRRRSILFRSTPT